MADKYYIIRPLVREARKPRANYPNPIRQVIIGQFPLSIDIITGEFAIGGSRLTATDWIRFSGEVDTFLEKHGWVEKVEVFDFRPSMLKRILKLVRHD